LLSPVFDTQIAAACIASSHRSVMRARQDAAQRHHPEGQTRTDWSKRPLTHEQLEYAADDVLYLGAIADELTRRLTELQRRALGARNCLELEDRRL